MLNLKTKAFQTLVDDELYAKFLDALSHTACYNVGDYYYENYVNDISEKIMTVDCLKQYLDNLPFINDSETITINANTYDEFTQDADFATYETACLAKGFTLQSA